MRIQLLTVILSISSVIGVAQTAPDFTATDCNGYSHNLYSELNAGKVIVLNWVMPCAACVGPTLTAYNIVQSYANPNVVHYLIDDVGNTSCTSLSTWASNFGIGTNRTTFSTSAIVENNYGGVGMPHVVVVGGSNHTIYFNGLNSAAGNSTAIQNAINAALAATGIQENNNAAFQFSISSSLTAHTIKLNYSINEIANVTLEVMNETGQLVMKKDLGKQAPGDYTSDLDLNNAAAGLYFLRFTANNNSQTAKFTFVH